MNDLSKISTSHLCRAACIYLRQSTPAQVEHNRESTQRQYALASKATTLGWPSQQVVVIDPSPSASTSSPVSTKRTPGILRAAATSSFLIFACATCERSTKACAIFSSLISSV